jgi:hypothetical protein
MTFHGGWWGGGGGRKYRSSNNWEGYCNRNRNKNRVGIIGRAIKKETRTKAGAIRGRTSRERSNNRSRTNGDLSSHEIAQLNGVERASASGQKHRAIMSSSYAT